MPLILILVRLDAGEYLMSSRLTKPSFYLEDRIKVKKTETPSSGTIMWLFEHIVTPNIQLFIQLKEITRPSRSD